MLKSFHSVQANISASLRQSGLADTDFRILEALLHKGPLPVNVIGPKVFLTPGSISIAVDRLCRRGLVSRVESTNDRRVRVVTLTPVGQELIAAAFQKHAEAIENVMQVLAPEELAGTIASLRKLGKYAVAKAAYPIQQ